MTPSDKTTREPNQDDFKTVWDPPRGRNAQDYLTPRGPFKHPKRHQNGADKRSKIEAKIQEAKKAIQEDLGAVLGDLGDDRV